MSAPPRVHSLGERLASINQATLINAVIIIGLVVIISSFLTGLATLISASKGTAAVLAANTGAILVFEDVQTAEGLLSSLSHADNVEAVAIYREDLQPFASFVVSHAIPATLPVFGESLNYGFNRIELIQPIVNNGETLGMLYLLVSLNSLYVLMLIQFVMTIGAMLLALHFARRQSGRLSTIALQPLLQLTQLMETVSTDANLRMRAPASEIRELDTLTRGFNGMLEQIQERDLTLAAHRGRLEDEVASRTAQLIEARDSAQASSRAKSEFLATMSHEIRTPMNGVLGMTELLLHDKLSPEQRRFALSVQSSGRHLLGTINAILDFSKIESGHMELETVDFSLGELVENVLEMFAQPAEEKGLELAGHVSPPNFPFMLRGDPFRLRQVLTNLIGNAVKFTSTGEVIARASIVRETATAAEICVVIEDTGIGISAPAQLKIFEHFKQADGSTTRQYGGTGLGLAICKRLVELMGGNIGVTSEPGRGSRFTVHLAFPKGAAAHLLTADSDQLRQVRVIVVDDNATNREILQEQLGAWDMRVTAATNGAQALQLMMQAQIEHDPFQLAILDMHMPQMDGLELAAKIQLQPALRDTRMVMLTSTHAAGSKLDRERAGILRFVYKPIRQAELLEVVQNALSTALLPGAQDAQGARDQEESGPATAAFPAGHVLLAEDNPVNQQVAEAMLRKLGLTTTIVTNGAEALAMAALYRFDLVLMDCQMPVMDGFQATAAIRKRLTDAPGHIPIIALTANSLEGDRETCLDAGMNDYLSKPYSLIQLEAVLRRWLPAAGVDNTGVAAMPEEESPVLDQTLIQQLRDIDPAGSNDLLRKVMQLYLDTTPDMVAETERAALAADTFTLRRLAHSLKSSSDNVGALALSALFRRLEELGKNEKVEDATALLAELRAAYERATSAMRTLLLTESTA